MDKTRRTIKSIRVLQGIDMEELSEKTGIDMPTLTKIESDEKIPTDNEKQKIAIALGQEITKIRFAKAIFAHG